jgi:hypothetical protein
MQNGRNSPISDRPCWRHTQRRLSSKEGTMHTAMATTLASVGDRWKTSTFTPRMRRPRATEMIDAPE